MGKVLKRVVKHATPGVRDLIPVYGSLKNIGEDLQVPIIRGVATVIAGYFGGPAGVAAVSAVASFGAATSKERGLSFSGSEALGRLLTASDPQAFGSWVFGETALQSNIVYAEQYGSENQFGLQVIAGAAHEIDSFGQMYINDEAVNFSGNNATGSWSGAVRRFTRNGTEGQTAITVSGSSWPSTAKFSGVCHYALEWDASHDKVKGGVPRRVTQVVRGAPVYDPRFDSDVGGSGTQRADDQTTWSYQNGSGDAGANWALIVLFYLLGWRLNGRLVIGMGVDKDDIDYASFIEAANVCDALKDGIPQYHLGGILPTNGDHSTTLSQLEQMIGGVITKGFDGVWRVWAPNGNLVPVGTITENDLVAEEAEVHDPGGNLEVLYNTGRARFVNPATLYQPDDAPDVVDPGALSDDGRERLVQVDLTAVQHEARAQRIIHHLIRRSRFQRTWTVAIGPKGILYNYFDVLTLNTQTTNYQDQLVRVVGVQASTSGVVILTVREEDPLIYQLDLELGTLGQRNIPPTFDPSTKIAVTGMTLEATSVSGQSGTVRPAISVSFNDPGPLVDKTQIEYRKQGDSNWTTGAANFVDNISAVIQPLHPSTTYQVRVNHVSVSGVAGGWSQLSAETGPLESTLWSGVTGPGRPEDGAQVNAASTLALLINTQTDGTANTGEFALIGTSGGAPALGTDGFINWYGQTITIPGGQLFGRISGVTNVGHAKGFIAFDTQQSNPFVLSEGLGSIDIAFVRKLSNGQWQYDDNASWVDFTPTDDMAALGWLKTLAPDSIESGGLFGTAVPLDLASFPSADVTSDNVSADTSQVNGVPAADVQDGSSRALAVIRADLGSVEDISIYQNGTIRRTTRGFTEGPVRDGDAVVFSQSWDSMNLPVIGFQGGRTDQGTLANETNARYRALNLSPSGFTADLKIVEAIGSPVVHQDNEAPGGTNLIREVQKSQAQQAVDDTYYFRFDLRIYNGPEIEGIPARFAGSVTLGFYTNDGGGWVQRKTKTLFGSSALSDTDTVHLNQLVDVFVDGVGQISGAEFRVVVEDAGPYGADLLSIDHVEYTTAGPAGFVTATPPGSPDMRFEVKGGVE